MKFIISSEVLLKTIQPIIGIIVNNPALPIIENILIELKDNTLSAKATDLETTIINTTTVESESDAAIAVSLNKVPEIPSIKINGKKTATKIKVVAIIAKVICREPL